MSARADFLVKFWGVRGSIAMPGPTTVRYGGNTTCIEIRCGEHLLIIDGGTGMRNFGLELAKEQLPEINLFFTHTHFDHICGVPFFKPAYLRTTTLNFWAGHLPSGQSIKRVLCDLMMAPLFPVPIDVFSAANYHDFECGVPLEVKSGVRVNSFALNHPNGACGYRIDFDGRSVCVITDNEHRAGELDQPLVDFVRGADIMIYDAMFTDEEFGKFVGWGHSTWQEALRVAAAADVGQTVLFHHDPGRDDGMLDRIEDEAAHIRPRTVAAREGMVLRP